MDDKKNITPEITEEQALHGTPDQADIQVSYGMPETENADGYTEDGIYIPKQYRKSPEEEAAAKRKVLKIVAIVLVLLLLGGTMLYTLTDFSMDDIANDMVREFRAEDFGLASTEAFDFTVYDRDGNEYKLSDFEGQVVVMNFWASWCGPCQMEMGDFQRSYNEWGDEVQFMMINVTDGVSETVKSATEFYDDRGFTMPLFLDTDQDAISKYSMGALPVTFFISADGNIAAYSMGMVMKSNIAYGIELAEKASEN